MRNLKGKIIISLIITVVMVLGGFFILREVNVETTIKYRMEQRSQRISSIEAVFKNMERDRIRAYAEDTAEKQTKFSLEVFFLKEYIKDGEYTGPETLDDGAVCRIRDGILSFPESMPFAIELTAEDLKDEREENIIYVMVRTDDEDRMAMIRFEEIGPDIFFISWQNQMNAETNYLDNVNSMESAFAEIGEIYDGCLVSFGEDGKPLFMSQTDFFPAEASFSSLGLAADVFEKNPGIYRRGAEDGREEEEWYYLPVSSDIPGLERMYFFFRLGMDDPERTPDAAGQALIISAIMAMIGIGLTIWLISIQKTVRELILDQEQFRRYAPERIYRRTALICAVCVILVLATAAVENGMDSLRVELVRSTDLLRRIAGDTDQLEERQRTLNQEKEERLLRQARILREAMETNPGLRARDKLAEISEILDSEYIMVFDHQGKEAACSTDYVEFTLGEDEEDEMYPFRRLTMGVESMALEAREDKITGRNLVKIGVRMKMENGFGALILAMDPERVSPESVESTHTYILQAATQKDCVSFAAERESGRILYSSDNSLNEKNAGSLGLGEMLDGDNPMAAVSLNNMNYYGASISHNGRSLFYLFSASFLTRKMTPFIWIAAGLALALGVMISLTLLRGYTRKEYEILARTGHEVFRGRTVEIVTADGRIRKTVDPSLRWTALGLRWKKMTPEQKAKTAVQLSMLTLSMLVLFMNRGQFEGGLYRYIMNGEWQRGANLMALGKTVIMIFAAGMGLILVRYISAAACQSMGTKGETVFRMLYNLLQYIAAFTVLYYAFQNFGLDTGGLLGAIGAVTLAVSLGSKDAMSDIIAGMNIVIEGEFQVGDIVQIDNTKGKVMDVGIRTTKLLCQGENVSIFNNRDIKKVTNLSRFNSWYGIEITISADCDINWLEELLQKELPEIGSRIKNIISGPVYKGIESIGKGSYTILLLAECLEENLNNVHRSLNREIRMMLAREKIPLQ